MQRGFFMRKKLSLQQQANEILKLAEESGLQGNYFFRTTFDRYQTLLQVLDKLKDNIKNDGVLVTKQYVKGRENMYVSPALKEYNRTTDSANKTLTLLVKIIKEFYEDDQNKDIDPLLSIINGVDDE